VNEYYGDVDWRSMGDNRRGDDLSSRVKYEREAEEGG